MDEKNLKVIRYLTGAIFAVQFIISLPALKRGFGWGNWLLAVSCTMEVIGVLLMAISLFIGIYSLLTIGAGMKSIGILIGVFTGRYEISVILIFIAYALIALTTRQKKNAITIGIVSAGLIIIRGFLGSVRNDYFWETVPYALNEWTVLLAAAAILICVVVRNTPQIKPIKTSQPTIAQKTGNCIEELTKLKDLLDTGVITQEEFDAKKKQILGV